jgi:hypothetical protein
MDLLDEIKKEILICWKNEFCSRKKELNNKSYNWESMFLGLCIANGLTSKEADNLYKKYGYQIQIKYFK